MQRDQLVFDLIQKELERQRHGIELIASENFTSIQVMQAMGNVMTNGKATIPNGNQKTNSRMTVMAMR